MHGIFVVHVFMSFWAPPLPYALDFKNFKGWPAFFLTPCLSHVGAPTWFMSYGGRMFGQQWKFNVVVEAESPWWNWCSSMRREITPFPTLCAQWECAIYTPGGEPSWEPYCAGILVSDISLSDCVATNFCWLRHSACAFYYDSLNWLSKNLIGSVSLGIHE